MLPDFEIWLDNHLSPIIAKWLSDDLNLIVKSSYTLNTWGLSDNEIYEKAKRAEILIIIVSKDTDLDQIISIKGSPPKLIKLTIGNCSNKLMFSILKQNIPKALKLLFDFNKDIIEINSHE
jgi:predicted nuclease of predicted toxin-antitoxin system